MVNVKTLPIDTSGATMSRDEEINLIRLSRAGDRAAQSTLVERHLGAVRQIAGKLKKIAPTALEYDDLVQEGSIGLLRAIDRFDLTRTTRFITYAWTVITMAMLARIRSERKHDAHYEANGVPDVPVDEPPDVEGYIGRLGGAELAAVCLRYGLGGADQHNARQISSILGISVSCVEGVIESAFAKMRSAV